MLTIICHIYSRQSRKYSMPEYPGWRKRSGAFLPPESRKMSIQPDEAAGMHEADQDDLASKYARNLHL